MDCDLASIWLKYKDTADPAAKSFLIEYYLPFVKNIAVGVIRKLKVGVVELDDLISDGTIGLIRAVEQFDPGRGIKFETYATTVVKGAIYNGIRALDWVPERTREKTRALQKAMDNFSMIHGREGSEAELADHMNMDVADIYNLIVDLGCVYMLSLEQPIASDEEDSVVRDYIEDREGMNPVEEIEFAEQRQVLMDAINSLGERDASIIKLHYFSGLSFEKIAQKIGVSKQRISQLHTRIIRQLRRALSSLDIAFDRNFDDNSYSVFDTKV